MTDLPALILLPGLATDTRLFARQVEALAGLAAARVADLSGADTMAALADGVLATAPPRFALAGLSMGGYVALEIMRRAPGRVTALALLDTSARPDTPESTANRERLIALAARDYPAVVEELLPKLLHPDHVAGPAADMHRAMALSLGPAVFTRQQRAIIGRADSRPHLAAIRCPVLVLCGREDQPTPVAVHEEMAAAIPGAELVVIERCGHLSTLEHPDRVSGALAAWLARAPGDAAAFEGTVMA